jgi:hypothetical protein
MAIDVENVATRFTPLARIDAARNTTHPNGKAARALAEAANFLLGRSPPHIPAKSVLTMRNSASDLALWRTRYRASANGTTLVAEVLLAPTDNTTATQPQWYLKVDGSATAKRSHNNRCAGGSGTNISDWFPDKLETTVTAGAKHTVELWTTNCRVVSWTLREKERDTLTVGTDAVVDWATLGPGHGITYADLQALSTDIEAVREKMRGCSLSFSVDNPATPLQPVAGAAAVNAWDSTDTVKPTIPTQYRDTLSLGNIPMYTWVYAERTAGAGNGHIAFTSSLGTTTITINGAAGIYDATSWTLADQAGDEQIDVKVDADAATTIKIYSFGCFPLIGT